MVDGTGRRRLHPSHGHPALYDKIPAVRLFAWMGGGLFALALVRLVDFYAVRLASADARDAGHPLRAVLLDVTLFGVFALHHSLLARPRVKAAVATLVPARAERAVYVWVASLLLLLVCEGWQSVPGVVYDVPGWGRGMLYGVQMGGVALSLGAVRAIDALTLAGIRPLTSPRQDAIQMVGPFRWVRHPIYLGWLLMVFGTPLMTVNRLLFAVISTSYLILAIPWEEQSLVAAHGDQYRAYQQAVRWRLLPGVW